MSRLSRILPLLLLMGLAACHSAPGATVWKLELMTNPTPPIAGASTLFRSLLITGADAPVDGGAATVLLSLPSRTGPPLRIQLEPRGNGIYEGRATLPAPGTWTALLTMTRHDHTEIRRFSISARPPS
ncbi:MAG: FixH family protein [Terriglobales bacterium]